MVGTIEPRKGHRQVLDAMELLWAEGIRARLTILGRHGWMMEDFVARVRAHPEFGRRLVLDDTATDDQLRAAYGRSDCLVLASLGEGFGLPLVEAATHDLPVLARDLPVFREVAGDRVGYFSGTSADALADALRQQVARAARGELRSSGDLPVLTWQQSADELVDALGSALGINLRGC